MCNCKKTLSTMKENKKPQVEVLGKWANKYVKEEQVEENVEELELPDVSEFFDNIDEYHLPEQED